MPHQRIASLLLLVTSACAVNPATGRSELALISEAQEVQMGLQAAQQVRQQQAVLGDPKVQAYVSELGKRIAATTERPALPWQFTVLDDPVVNAFALPGGSIFVTRGILTHLNSEAELASVLGHEAGHVTARHSVREQSRQQLATIGIGLASILSPKAGELAGAAQAGLGLLFLKFSRGDETEADGLGFRYALRGQYDVREMNDLFSTLAKVSGNSRLPDWQSTHPAPEDRALRTRFRLDSAKVTGVGLVVRREEYLRMVDGMVYGTNPRNGFFQGSRFYHPDLALQLDFPAGWSQDNGDQMVAAGEPQGKAVVQFSLEQGTPEAASTAFLGQQGMERGPVAGVSTGLGSGLAASFRAQGSQGTVEGWAAWVASGGRTWRILGLTGAGGLETYGAVFRQVAQSLAPVRDRAVLDVQPNRVQLMRVPRAMTAAEFVRQYPASVPAEQVLVLNNWEATTRLAAGTLVKQVVAAR